MWRLLSSPFYRLSGLTVVLLPSQISQPSRCDSVLGALACVRRLLPQTTFSPCRPLPTDHLILHALMAPGERRGGQPLLKIGPRRAPCLLPSCPPQPSLAARTVCRC